MQGIDNKTKVAMNTIQYLAANKQACPEFLGEVDSAEKAGELAAECDAVFNMAIIQGKPIVRGNPRKLIPSIQAVAEANGIKLNDSDLLDVCVEVVDAVGSDYLSFLGMSESEFEAAIKAN